MIYSKDDSDLNSNNKCIKCGQCCLFIALPFDNTDTEAVQWIEARFGKVTDPSNEIVLIPHRCESLNGDKPGEYECIADPKPARCINFPEDGEPLLTGCGYIE